MVRAMLKGADAVLQELAVPATIVRVWEEVSGHELACACGKRGYQDSWLSTA